MWHFHRAVAFVLLIASPVLALEVGQAAPDFNSTTFSGQTINLASQQGKVVYLDFWASWCAPCRKTLPWMSELQQKYAGQGLAVLAVNEDSKPLLAEAMIKEQQAGFTTVADTGGRIASAYALPAMPSSFLIDRQGRVHAVFRGFREGDELEIESQINKLLADDQGVK